MCYQFILEGGEKKYSQIVIIFLIILKIFIFHILINYLNIFYCSKRFIVIKYYNNYTYIEQSGIILY